MSRSRSRRKRAPFQSPTTATMSDPLRFPTPHDAAESDPVFFDDAVMAAIDAKPVIDPLKR